ncbi:MAG: OmpA family protein [Planctomycetia bacterium]|nr:OmpA family protein [Planctomycetia bacterium]
MEKFLFRKYSFLTFKNVGAYLLIFSLTLSGCANNSLTRQGQLSDLEREKTALSNQYASLRDRNSDLERANNNVTVELAANKQQMLILQDEVALVRKQLGETTEKLAIAQQEKSALDKRINELSQALERQGGISIEPNISLTNLETPVFSGAATRVEKGNIYISIPGATLFERGGDQFTPHGLLLLRQVAGQVAQHYPGQKIVIESHANTLQQTSSQFQSKMDQTASQAMMVYNVLTNENIFQREQISVSACGTGRPLVSNNSEDGAAKNYRIELIVTPN